MSSKIVLPCALGMYPIYLDMERDNEEPIFIDRHIEQFLMDLPKVWKVPLERKIVLILEKLNEQSWVKKASAIPFKHEESDEEYGVFYRTWNGVWQNNETAFWVEFNDEVMFATTRPELYLFNPHQLNGLVLIDREMGDLIESHHLHEVDGEPMVVAKMPVKLHQRFAAYRNDLEEVGFLVEMVDE